MLNDQNTSVKIAQNPHFCGGEFVVNKLPQDEEKRVNQVRNRKEKKKENKEIRERKRSTVY